MTPTRDASNCATVVARRHHLTMRDAARSAEAELVFQRTERAKPVILHVLEAFAGGTERHLIDLVRHIDQFQHVVAIPSRHQGASTTLAAARIERAGAQVEWVEMGRSRAPHTHAVALAALRRLLRSVEPNVVHGHSSVGGALARLATWRMAVPVVYTPHGFNRSHWAISAERLLCKRADRLIAVSLSEREFAEAHRLAIPDRVVVIPNGIDPEPPSPLAEPLRKRLGIVSEVPLVGFVGRLAWQKAPEIFVAASAIVHDVVPEAHFVLIGSGPLREEVDQALSHNGIGDWFHLIPSLPNAASAIAEFDVYALPSRFEGGPYTPIEAMRGETAVVVTDVAGNNDIVQDRVNGLLVPQGQPHSLADGIISLLKNAALRQDLIESGRETAARYDVREMATATATLYCQLLA
jgi:glycosyltransferase involved in cell wall biosynthesis